MKLKAYSLSLLVLWAGLWLAPIVRAQSETPDPYSFWIGMMNAQNVLSLLVFIFFIGFGRWFDTKGWPWFSEFMETRQKQDFDLREKRQKQEFAIREEQQKRDCEYRQEANALQRDTLQIIGSVSLALGEAVQLMQDNKALMQDVKRIIQAASRGDRYNESHTET